MINKLENRCSFYDISRNIKKIDVNLDISDGYKELGCFDCDGFNFDCPEYFVAKIEYEKGLGCNR